MSLQPKFRSFHEKIHLRRFSENATLVQKRDAVLNRLRTERTFTFFNQGSYEMGTGVKPVGGDYDIDVGVVFDLSDLVSMPQPKTVKGWVHSAVQAHTKLVRWKEPCITVQYQASGEPIYHVDLAIYGKDRYGRLFLARGKEHASDARWEPADPQGLTKAIGTRFAGEDDAQFRRVIQYLKRWKDLNFPAEGNAAPVGIGLTLLAYGGFAPVKGGYPTPTYDDLTATRNLVTRIAGSFTSKWTSTGTMYRIAAPTPVEPRGDVFAGMTDQQTTEFKGRVDRLKVCLDQAATSGSAASLRQAFGADFPE